MLTGKPAPLFNLTAVVTNRHFQLQAWQGQPVLLIFVDHRSAMQSRDITSAVRQVFPQHTEVIIASIANLRIVPRLMRGVAQGFMETAFHQAAAEIPPGYHPADHLIILPDWDGKVCQAYGVQDVSRQPTLVLVHGNGRVHATYQGPQPATSALDLLTGLMAK